MEGEVVYIDDDIADGDYGDFDALSPSDLNLISLGGSTSGGRDLIQIKWFESHCGGK